MGLLNVLDEIKEKWPYEIDRIRMRLGLLPEQNWEDIEKYFIISTGRTGTKFFARFLDGFNNILASHEPTPDFLNLAIKYARGKVDIDDAVPKIRYNRRALCREVKRKQVTKYIESNNRLFSLIDPLEEIFDDFKIIHIIRDGRDYVRSGMSFGWWYTPEDHDPRLKAIYFPDDPYYDKWEEMNQFEKICWRWKQKDGFILEKVKDMPNAITVKFEDIFKDEKHSGVYRIANFIGLPKQETEEMIDKMINRQVNSTKKYAIPKWPEWDLEMKKQFEEIAGEHMEKYYDYNWDEEKLDI